MRKHLFARALACVLSVSLLSTTAFAAPIAFDQDVHVDNDGSLLGHTNEDSEDLTYDYYLDSDVELDKTLVIKDGVDASIDLNGYELSLNKDQKVDTGTAEVETTDEQKVGSVIEVNGEGTTLTVTDKTRVPTTSMARELVQSLAVTLSPRTALALAAASRWITMPPSICREEPLPTTLPPMAAVCTWAKGLLR